eukprot:PITA_33049
MELYFDNWTVFRLVKHHVASLGLMLDTCRRYQITLNLKKCLVCVPFGILLGYVEYREGLMVDLAKIAIIINLEAPRSVKQLCAMLGHTAYYRKLIKSYAQITASTENLLKKDDTFCWNEKCQQILDVLKEKMVIAPILVFPNWKKEFHVHVDASCIALEAVLAQDGEGELDHPIAFVNHLLRIDTGEEPTNLEEGLPYVYLFAVHVANNHFAYIIHFLMMGMALKGYTSQQKKELVLRTANFSVIAGNLYKMGSNEILRCYVPEFERSIILLEAHGGVAGGHYAGKATA